MKAVIQNYLEGSVKLQEIPAPKPSADSILIRNRASLISLGTERSMLEFGRKTLLQKILAKPEMLRKALRKARQDGYWKVYLEGRNRLDQDRALGYSSAGVVVEAGLGAGEFAPGDRVACMGQDFASHAEYICVPQSSCAKIPEGVEEDEAAFAMVACIALHGIHQCAAQPGGRIAVIGLGLIGQITVQILKAYGFQVGAEDTDDSKMEMALQAGASKIGAYEIDSFDAVLVCAASSGNAPLMRAVELSRHAASIVLVGVADIHFDRQPLWEKEIRFTVSKAAGPQESLNMKEVLRLLKERRLDFKKLITHRFSFEEALKAYQFVKSAPAGERPIGILLQYRRSLKEEPPIQKIQIKETSAAGIGVGFIGTGLFARSVLLPECSKIPGLRLQGVASSGGVSSAQMARKYGFSYACTDYREILKDPRVEAVLIATRSGLHAKITAEALAAGKWVFVEKPLAVSAQDLELLMDTASKHGPRILTGFNRRYSEFGRWLPQVAQAPWALRIAAHPAAAPSNHWVYQESEGGGRIFNEVCHYIDFSQHLNPSGIRSVQSQSFSAGNEHPEEHVNINLGFHDGSSANIFYSARPSHGDFREQYLLDSPAAQIAMTDFKILEGHVSGSFMRRRLWAQDLGHAAELAYFFERVRGKQDFSGEFRQYKEGILACLAAKRSLAEGGCLISL